MSLIFRISTESLFSFDIAKVYKRHNPSKYFIILFALTVVILTYVKRH